MTWRFFGSGSLEEMETRLQNLEAKVRAIGRRLPKRPARDELVEIVTEAVADQYEFKGWMRLAAKEAKQLHERLAALLMRSQVVTEVSFATRRNDRSDLDLVNRALIFAMDLPEGWWKEKAEMHSLFPDVDGRPQELTIGEWRQIVVHEFLSKSSGEAESNGGWSVGPLK